ncbi:restriction endonuclease subunit S [Rheinheimera gaetbuli]
MERADLPVSWALTPIDDAISSDGLISDGDWVESKDQDPSGSVRLIQLADIGDGEFKNKSDRFMTEESAASLNCTYLHSGDILVARMPDPLGRACIFPGVGQQSVTVVDVCLIRTGDKSAVSNKLLTYWINSPDMRGLIADNASGTTRKRITRKKLEKFEIPLPPLAEQKVIAEKLDTLLAQVDNTKARLERIPDILKRFRQSVLAAAISGKLTEEWRKRKLDIQSAESIRHDMKINRLTAWLTEQEKSFAKTNKVFEEEQLIKKYSDVAEEYQDEFNLTAITEIPECWLATNLDNVSIAVTGKTPSTTDEENWNGNIPFISPTQILPDGKVTKPERFVTDFGAKKIQLLPKGAVMIVCIGTIGKVGLLNTDAAFNQQINALIPTQSIQSKFLFYWARTLHSWLNKTSSAVVNAAIINKSRLCSAPCPLPSIEEQTEIVRRVEELFAFADRIEHAAQAALSRVNNLTQSILAKAFRGELTADWRAANPELISGEHSAEALLARIKAERAKVKPKPKKAN